MAAVTALTAMAGSLAAAAPAHATIGGVTCILGSNTVAYSPPLTNQRHDVDVTIDRNLRSCVATTEPALTSGISHFTFSLDDRTCVELVNTSTQNFTLTWNTGQTTTISSTSYPTIVGAVYTVTAQLIVTDGLFKGRKGIANYTGPATDILLCTLGLGTVEKVETIATLEIFPL